MDAIKMVEVTRSDFIESIHYGAAVLINSDGKMSKFSSHKHEKNR